MIAQRKISTLANRLAEGSPRRIPERTLERHYCLAWFLVALSRTGLRPKLAFKGGTALKHCYYPNYRFSEDLDFTLLQATPFDALRGDLEAVFTEIQTAAGILFRFVRADSSAHANSYTFFIGYEGPLPATGGTEVKVDVTIKERIVFPLEERHVLRTYEEFDDLPGDARVQVYSLDEIAAEKTVALMSRARNEPRDLYDLWYLVNEGSVDLENLANASKQKWAFRGQTLLEVRDEFREKESRLKSLWETRLSAQMIELPEFDQAYRAVSRMFREAGLTAQNARN